MFWKLFAPWIWGVLVSSIWKTFVIWPITFSNDLKTLGFCLKLAIKCFLKFEELFPKMLQTFVNNSIVFNCSIENYNVLLPLTKFSIVVQWLSVLCKVSCCFPKFFDPGAKFPTVLHSSSIIFKYLQSLRVLLQTLSKFAHNLKRIEMFLFNEEIKCSYMNCLANFERAFQLSVTLFDRIAQTYPELSECLWCKSAAMYGILLQGLSYMNQRRLAMFLDAIEEICVNVLQNLYSN